MRHTTSARNKKCVLVMSLAKIDKGIYRTLRISDYHSQQILFERSFGRFFVRKTRQMSLQIAIFSCAPRKANVKKNVGNYVDRLTHMTLAFHAATEAYTMPHASVPISARWHPNRPRACAQIQGSASGRIRRVDAAHTQACQG